MNVYDFDGTMFHGDSEDSFMEYALKHLKIKFRHRFEVKFFYFLRKIKLVNAQTQRNHTYPYISYIPDIEKIVKDFWDEYEKNIFPYYHENHRDDDVVVSATPRFILKEIVKRLKIKTLICSEVDLKTGKMIGKMCYADEKETYYNKVFNKKPFDNYYFDNDHDMCLLKYAKNGYRVYDGELKKVK
ncbi:MAG: haloacid dehalogenase-like hydrolase [Bacilli bacterium]|nr:haloacid dehalogenase-like hydrolase [Bacilli bacterium]